MITTCFLFKVLQVSELARLRMSEMLNLGFILDCEIVCRGERSTVFLNRFHLCFSVTVHRDAGERLRFFQCREWRQTKNVHEGLHMIISGQIGIFKGDEFHTNCCAVFPVHIRISNVNGCCWW